MDGHTKAKKTVRLASRTEVRVPFADLVKLCDGDVSTAKSRLLKAAKVQDIRTLDKIDQPKHGQEWWQAKVDDAVRKGIQDLIKELGEARVPTPAPHTEEYHGAPALGTDWLRRDDTARELSQLWEGGWTRVVQLVAP